METTVYGDLLFLINAGMDALCFKLTARLLRRPLRRGRLILGSALGGVYAVAALLPEFSPWAAILTDLLACLCICLPVFFRREDGWRHFFPAVGVYLAVSMILGGIMTGLYNLLNRTGLCGVLEAAGEDGPTAWLFLLLAFSGGGIALLCGKLFRRAGALSDCRVRVTLRLDGRSAELNGLIDSGNLLRDPLTGAAVIPVSRQAVERLLPPALLDAVKNGSPASLTGTPEARRVRLIPAATAAGETLLLALRVDEVTITRTESAEDKRRKDPPSAVYRDLLIAPTELPDGGKPSPQALLPAELAP